VITLRQGALPKGLIARACEYALRIWSRLEVYLEDGQVQIDNNAAERSIRPVALGRKNWLHFGSKEAGPRIAAILSVVETCQRNRVSVREYLFDVLPRLAGGQQADVASLTPQAWAKLQMIDVHLPTTDGRELLLRRRTEPTAEQQMLLTQLKLELPGQPPPKINPM
jgi:hypothetical protein